MVKRSLALLFMLPNATTLLRKLFYTSICLPLSMSFPDHLIDEIKDIQETKPDIPISLTKVGIRGHVFKLVLMMKSEEFVMYPRVDLYVDLPSKRRGAHLSRNLEALYEVLMENPKVKGDEIADFCSALSERLLQKHKYATTSYVHLEGEYLLSRSYSSSKLKAFERFNIFSFASSRRAGGKIESTRYIGVKAVGLTSCPCSQNLMRAWTSEDLKALGVKEEEISRILNEIPIATHTQRTLVAIKVQVPNGFSINIEDLIDIAERSLSEPTFALLKRPSEASLLRGCFKNSKFAEDVVRDVLSSILKSYKDMHSEALIAVRVISQESVHKHDVIAECSTTFGELRRELSVN